MEWLLNLISPNFLLWWNLLDATVLSFQLLLPVFTPPVNIHAPVVIAALMRPFPKTCLSFGWSSKFWRPPCTEMRSLGSSSCHSLVIRCRRRSGFVSKDTRTYCRNKNSSREKKIGYTHWFLIHMITEKKATFMTKALTNC